MPTWFLNRPQEKADPTELKVAQVFNKLKGDWYIRWGFYYNRNQHSEQKDREGDFVLLGPDGRILVVEVKSGQNRHFALTGEWEHGDDNPAFQLHNEWNGVIEQLENASNERIPYVGKALCLPYTNLMDQERLRGELSEDQLIFGKDLEDFPAWWSRHMASHGTDCVNPVKVFHSGVAKGIKPASIKMFLRQSDLLFDRFKASEFEILTMLQGNRQWMVEGGVGTGKTFLALQQARRLAEQGAGQRVLLLVYNLLLAERLQQMVARLKLTCGEIILHSWESLLEEILSEEQLKLDPPVGADAKRRYYMNELPAYIGMSLEEGKISASYDALVVDEAQDHDTRFSGGGCEGLLGWWSWYFVLLKGGTRAQAALFYDPAQRPAFRGADGFDADLIRSSLSQPVHVRLPRALRYTRPILDYLATLKGSGATELMAGSLQPHEALPVGPEVELRDAAPDATAAAVESILRRWNEQGLCKPSEVVLVGMRKELATSSLSTVETLCGFELVDYSEQQMGKLSYIGAHRSKGLDFLAVILIDFEPFETIAEPDRQEAFFMGASRARQLLGVVHLSSSFQGVGP